MGNEIHHNHPRWRRPPWSGALAALLFPSNKRSTCLVRENRCGEAWCARVKHTKDTQRPWSEDWDHPGNYIDYPAGTHNISHPTWSSLASSRCDGLLWSTSLSVFLVDYYIILYTVYIYSDGQSLRTHLFFQNVIVALRTSKNRIT